MDVISVRDTVSPHVCLPLLRVFYVIGSHTWLSVFASIPFRFFPKVLTHFRCDLELPSRPNRDVRRPDRLLLNSLFLYSSWSSGHPVSPTACSGLYVLLRNCGTIPEPEVVLLSPVSDCSSRKTSLIELVRPLLSILILDSKTRRFDNYLRYFRYVITNR